MSFGTLHPEKGPSPGGQNDKREKVFRREEDRVRSEAQKSRERQLSALLELGRLIGLDLNLNEMLKQVAQKAAEVMEADRCTLFLYDPKTDELWSIVAMGLEEQVIRIPSRAGIAGSCFSSGKTINLSDAYADPRFNREVDARTGYHTRNLLCTPINNRAKEIIGIIQLLNKKEGVFTQEDEAFVKTFGNHAAVFIEMAQLQKARIEALEQSQKELRRLNLAKDKALHHLSHELKTPLAIIQGTVRLLMRKLLDLSSELNFQKYFETLDRNISRLFEFQQETDAIIRAYQEQDEDSRYRDLDRLLERLEDQTEIPSDLIAQWNDLKMKITQYLPTQLTHRSPVLLFPLVQKTVEELKEKTQYRKLLFFVEGREDTKVSSDPRFLKEILYALLKNAIENTPDEGMICVLFEQIGGRVLLKVQDFGIGITEENQRSIFDGLFATQETELYSSKKPFDFNAGGKGLDLLRLKSREKAFGCELWLESRRCIHLPTDQDICAGRISQCPHCREIQDCLSSGGSTFFVSLPIEERGLFSKRRET